MSQTLSSQTAANGLTPVVAFTYADAANRIADTNRTPPTIELAVDKAARQVDTGDLYIVESLGPLVWRPLSPGLALSSGYKESTISTLSSNSALVDIAQDSDAEVLSFTITLKIAAKVHALMTFQASSGAAGGAGIVGEWAISIDGTDGGNKTRSLSGANDEGIGAIQYQTPDALDPGDYVVTGRHRRVSGTRDLETDSAELRATIC